MRKAYRIVATLTLAVIASLSLAAAAPAKARDRNHDRIPDRWEKRHKLSLKVKQARRDQDRDGLTNLGEYRAGTLPRDPDTDGDGTEDGDENAGRVVSFEGNVLTLTLAGGGTLSARVGEATKVKCRYWKDEPKPEQPAEKDEAAEEGAEDEDVLAKPSGMPGGGEDETPEESLDPEEVDEAVGDEEKSEDPEVSAEDKDAEHEGDSHEKHGHVHCGLDAVEVGAKVSEAKLELHRGRLFWTKLELR